MISRVILHNIKSHLHTELELAAGLNVIGGESDEGKSNIFRAITWALFNKPLGWNPKPWDRLKPKDKLSWVLVEFIDGNTVKRVRTFAGKNWYELNGEKLEGLRGNVPEQVEKVVNMNESNMQPQKDMFFLLDDTPGSVAKEINKVFDLTKMDVGLKNAQSRMNTAKGLQKDVESEIELKKKQIENLDWAETADVAVTKLMDREIGIRNRRFDLSGLQAKVEVRRLLQDQLDELPEYFQMDVEGLRTNMDRLEKAKQRLKQTKEAVKVTAHIGKALAETLPNVDMVIVSLDSIRENHENFEGMIAQAKACVDAVEGFKTIKEDLAGYLPDGAVDKIESLADRLTTLNQARINVLNVEGFVKTKHGLVEKINDLDGKIFSTSDALATIRSKMEVCPTCLRRKE